MWLLLRRRIGRVVTISTATARAVTILRVIVASRVWYVRGLPVWGRINRAWIGNGRRWHVRVSLIRIAIVWPVHPWVITVYPYNIALLLLWFRVTCNLCQFSRVIAVYGSANIAVAVRDARVRVSSFVSYGVNDSSGTWPVVNVIVRAYNSRPVYIDRIVIDNRSTVITVVDIVNPYRFARVASNFLRPWAAYIPHVVIDVSIVDDSSLVDDVNHTWPWYVITCYIRAADICLRSADPVVIRHSVTAAE